jgi:hypothetical protein
MDIHMRWPEEPRLFVHDDMAEHDGWVVGLQPNGFWRVWEATGRWKKNDLDSRWMLTEEKGEDVTEQLCGDPMGMQDVLNVVRLIQDVADELREEELDAV